MTELTFYNGICTIVTFSRKDSFTRLAFRMHPAYANFMGNDSDWLITFDNATKTETIIFAWNIAKMDFLFQDFTH